jgi:hypothetical protein
MSVALVVAVGDHLQPWNPPKNPWFVTRSGLHGPRSTVLPKSFPHGGGVLDAQACSVPVQVVSVAGYCNSSLLSQLKSQPPQPTRWPISPRLVSLL